MGSLAALFQDSLVALLFDSFSGIGIYDQIPLFHILPWDSSNGPALPCKIPPIFGGSSDDYGLTSTGGSEQIYLKSPGRKFDLTNYQKKSSVFGVCPNDSQTGTLPIWGMLEGVQPRITSCTR